MNPFNRRLKVFIYAANSDLPMDNIKKVEVYSAKSELKRSKIMEV